MVQQVRYALAACLIGTPALADLELGAPTGAPAQVEPPDPSRRYVQTVLERAEAGHAY